MEVDEEDILELVLQLEGPAEVKEKLRQRLQYLQAENERLHKMISEHSSASSPFHNIPDELITHILSFLSIKEVYEARLVCLRWATLGDDPKLQQWCVMRDCVPPAKPLLPTMGKKDWKWLYLSQHRKITDVETFTGLGSGILSPSNARYDGEWKDGKEHGFGIKYWPISKPAPVEDKDKDDLRDSSSGTQEPKKLIILYDCYEGYWQDGLEHGIGKYRWADGSEYIGDWVDGKRSGEGIYFWPNQSSYVGEWKDGHQDGLGTYCWPSGSLYAGGWRNGNQNGWGLKRWGDSSKYEGEWVDGQKQGKGTYSWIDGRRYKGNWADGKKQGYGEYLWSDGTIYEGEWDNGLRHGRGKMYWRDGSVFDGNWWKDRRLAPGEVGKHDARTLNDKPYDFYFAEDDEIWESRYREGIESYANKKRQEREEIKPKKLEVKKQKERILKRFSTTTQY